MKPGRIHKIHDETGLPTHLEWNEDDRLKCRGCGEFAPSEATVCAFCYAELRDPEDAARSRPAKRRPPLITTWEIMMLLAVLGLLHWLARVDPVVCAEAASSLWPWALGSSILLRPNRDEQNRRRLSQAQQFLRSLGLLGFPVTMALLAVFRFSEEPALVGLQVILALVSAAGTTGLALIDKFP